MNGWTVIVRYQPGTPKVYQVYDAPDADAAIEIVLLDIGYHPGVRIEAIRLPDEPYPIKPLNYRPLTSEEKMLIRYND